MIKLMALLMTSGILFTGCASDKESHPEFKSSKVIERMGGVDETPEWATGAKAMWAEGKMLYFANIVTLAGDKRPESCMEVAALKAKSKMLGYIQSNITTSAQIDEDMRDDPTYESITAFLAQGKISGAAIAGRYYEFFTMSSTSGERELKLRCAAKVSIKKATLERQLNEAMNPKKKGNPEVKKKLIDAQKKFIDDL